MSDTVKEIQETFVDIKQTYVDEKLREFFSAEGKVVNIDNICLFAAKTIEEYNLKAEKKLKGKQKLEAAVELAKSVVERSVAFVPEDVRRQIVKNIYHNIDAIEQTIQFIVDISNNPNVVNFGKWVENTKRAVKNVVTGENEEKTSEGKPKRGFFSRCLGCLCPPSNPEEEKEKEMVAADESTEPKPVSAEGVVVEDSEEKVEDSIAEKSSPKISKKEAKKQAEAEKLRKKIAELSMTPEEREARKKEEEEARKKEEEEAKKKLEEEKEMKRKAKVDAETKKKEEENAKIKAKADAEAEKLRKKLEELNMSPEEKEAKKKAAKEEKEAKKQAEEEARKKAKADAEAEKLRKKLEEIEGGKKEVMKTEETNEQKEN